MLFDLKKKKQKKNQQIFAASKRMAILMWHMLRWGRLFKEIQFTKMALYKRFYLMHEERLDTDLHCVL